MTYPKVSIIVLNWNGLKDTIGCLESLQKITYPNCEVIVVDNGSKGNDAQILQERFGDYIHLIRNDRNYGYAGGNNIGIKYAWDKSSPDYFLILNNDVVVAPDFLTEMVKVAGDDKSIGIVGPKVYYYDFPNMIHSAGMKINMWLGHFGSIGYKQLDAGQYDAQQEVDSISGCCLLIKKEVIHQAGIFDESFFSYWDEVDYCFRAQRAGFRSIYVPQAIAWHKKVLKKKLWGKLSYEEKASALAFYYWARNNFKFMRKHGTRGQYYTFLVHFFGCHLLFVTALCLLYHYNIRQLIAFYRGVRDGLFNSEAGAKAYVKD